MATCSYHLLELVDPPSLPIWPPTWSYVGFFWEPAGGPTVILPHPPGRNLQLKHLSSQTFLDGYKKFSQVAGLHSGVLVGGLVLSRGWCPQSPAHNAIGVPGTTKLLLARRAIRPLAANTFCILFRHFQELSRNAFLIHFRGFARFWKSAPCS